MKPRPEYVEFTVKIKKREILKVEAFRHRVFKRLGLRPGSHKVDHYLLQILLVTALRDYRGTKSHRKGAAL